MRDGCVTIGETADVTAERIDCDSDGRGIDCGRDDAKRRRGPENTGGRHSVRLRNKEA